MDLDAGNYNLDELVNALLLPVKNMYRIDELKKATMEKLETIRVAQGAEPEYKNALGNFFVRACVRIANAYGLEVPPDILDEFNTARVGLLPRMRDTGVFQQSNHMVTQHQEKRPINVHETQVKEGLVNPLQRTLVRKILNLNTRFRNNYAKTLSTDFIFSLPSPLKNVVSLKLESIEFPNTIYPFSSNLGSNSFTIKRGDVWTKVQVPNGYYDATSLVEYINAAFAAGPLVGIFTKYNPNTGKFIFLADPGIEFELDFSFGNDPDGALSRFSGGKCKTGYLAGQRGSVKEQVTMGWMLGYRKEHYTYAKDYQQTATAEHEVGYNPEGTFDSYGTRYFLISVNDYNNSHGSTIISPFTEDGLADSNIISKVPYGECIFQTTKDRCCLTEKRTYFGPVNLSRLQIRIYDEFGRIVDMNNMDYSMSFQLELLYDL